MKRAMVDEIISGPASADVAEQFIRHIGDSLNSHKDYAFIVNEAAYIGGTVSFKRDFIDLGDFGEAVSYKLMFPAQHCNSSYHFPEGVNFPRDDFSELAKRQVVGLVKDIAEDGLPEAISHYAADHNGYAGCIIKSDITYERSFYTGGEENWDGYYYPCVEITIIADVLQYKYKDEYPIDWKGHKRKPLKAGKYERSWDYD